MNKNFDDYGVEDDLSLDDELALDADEWIARMLG